jgi:hypothetical protein
MDGTKIVAAWKEWVDSEEGMRAADPQTLGANVGMRVYLENRLQRAFYAGINVGATAVEKELSNDLLDRKTQ